MNIFISLSVIFWSLFPSLLSYTQGNELPQKIKLTNLVSNGDLLLAKPSPNQNEPFGFRYTTSTNLSLSGGIATFTATSQYGGFKKDLLFGVNNQIIYSFAYFKTNSSQVRFFGINPTVGEYHSGNDTFQFFSFIQTKINDELAIFINDYRTSAWTPIEVDYIGSINLTAVFGAGNEPTKTYMDSIFNEIGYFEGDYYYSSSLNDNYKWFSTGFVDKTSERDFLDYLGFFVWLAVPPISIYLLYKLMKGVIYE